MRDDELKRLLDSIGTEDAPEADDVDPRWEDYAAGALGEGEARRLAAVAAMSARGQEILDVHAPLGEDFERRTAERLLAQRVAAPAPVVLAPAPRRPSSLWEPLLRWLRAPGFWAPVLVAVALTLYIQAPRGPALPEYAAELRGGDKVARGAEAEAGRAVLSTGSRLDLVVRPAQAVSGPVSAAVFRLRDGRAEPAGLEVTVDARGAVRVVGVVGQEIPAEAGALELAVVVAAGVRAPTGLDDGQVVRVGVEIRP